MVAGLREPDEVVATGTDPTGSVGPVGSSAGSQVRELATVRLGWRERLGELSARIASRPDSGAPRASGLPADSPDGAPPPPNVAALKARLERIDHLLNLLSGAPVAAPEVAAPPALAVAPPAPVVAAPPAAALPMDELPPEAASGVVAESSDTPSDELPARHDTVVMDAASIREAFSSDPEMAALVRRLAADEDQHDTVMEMPAVREPAEADVAPNRRTTEVDVLPSGAAAARAVEEIESIEEAELLLDVDQSHRPPATPEAAATRTSAAQAAADEEEPFTSEWPREVELLYEDVHWLFQLGDIDGALISLERLLVLAPENEEIQAFVSLNERKLLEIYQSVLGAWERVPRISEGGLSMPVATSTGEKVGRVLKLIDGTRTVRQILGGSSLNRLEACSVLSQLMRARVIVFDDQPAAGRGA